MFKTTLCIFSFFWITFLNAQETNISFFSSPYFYHYSTGRSLNFTNGNSKIIYSGQSDDDTLYGHGKGFIAKSDLNGNFEWKKYYSVTDLEYAHYYLWSSKISSSNNIISVGSAISSGEIASDAVVMSTDSNGVLQWSKAITGNGKKYLFDIVEVPGSGYMCSGITTDSSATVSFPLILMIDYSGNLLWSKQFSNASSEWFSRMTFVDNYIYYIFNKYNTGGFDGPVLAKIDLTGNLQWSKHFSSPKAIAFSGIAPAPNGRISIIGYVYSSPSQIETFLAQVDSAGSVLWDRYYSFSERCFVGEPLHLPDGDILMSGFIQESVDCEKACFLRTDSAGNFLSAVKTGPDSMYTSIVGCKSIDGNQIFCTGGSDSLGDACSILTFQADRSFSSTCFSVVAIDSVPTLNLTAIPESFVYSMSNDSIKNININVTLANYNEEVFCSTCDSAISLFTYSESADTFYFNQTIMANNYYLWDFGDGQFSAALNPSHIYSSPGVYTICLTTTNSCSIDSSCIQINNLTTHIDQTQLDAIKYFPNPVKKNQRFLISWNNNKTPESVKIISVDGMQQQAIYTLNNNSSEIDVSRLAPGIYLLTLNFSNAFIKPVKIIVTE
ncbi:MAG TPA: PKD domain-containing protein [Bacteroidia bacterium]|nr:PKD domain-containing protein [Bacteroidia bacterium]